MMRLINSFPTLMALMCSVLLIVNVDAISKGEYLAPASLAADQGRRLLYIAEAGANQIVVFDTTQNRTRKTISLPESPNGMALDPRNGHLFVTAGQYHGKVYDVRLRAGVIEKTIEVGHTPSKPVLSADNRTLYVCNRFTNDVSVVDVELQKEITRIPVKREPVDAALTPDGHYLYVSNQLPADAANTGFIAAEVSVIDTSKNEICASISLLNGATSLRGIAISPDGKFAYVAHVLARYQLPTTHLERGWMNTNALAIIDTRNKKHLNTVLLDDFGRGAANPWDVACSPDGKHLCITHAGTQELSIIDRISMHERLLSEQKNTVFKPHNDLSFLTGLKRRIQLNGNGARSLALLGDFAYVTEYFTDTLSYLDIRKLDACDVESITLGSSSKMSTIRKGEMYFHDAQSSFQNWQSCNSCHPAEGRPDALNWDLLNDGLGNPKNTKSLLLSHQTPPAMITGVRKDAPTAVRAGMKFIEFAVRPEEDLVAIDEYLNSLKPVPSPYLVNGKLSPAAERGKEVFQEIRCNRCHEPPLFTDLELHEVGTGEGMDTGKEFDTPTLIEVWRTAPYLHNGNAATMMDLFVSPKAIPEDRHVELTKDLSQNELEDLVEYVLSIGPRT